MGQKEKMLEAIVREVITSAQLRPLLELRSFPYQGTPKGREIGKTDEKKNAEIISTLYFGGGTPSILSIDELKMIFDALHNRFVFADDIEITLEANPDDITEIKLQEWRTLGINRLSVGIQSFVEAELVWMNRAHNAAESLLCIDKIREAGFTNFSVDLIYGSPLLSDEDWKKNIDIVIEKNIPHISCYALTVEPKTALDKMIAQHKKENVDAEKQARQFLLLMDWMDQAGYEHYEISNFAKPGLRSKHNSSYWSGEPYYAFGPAAHAFDGQHRRWNVANNASYIQSLQKGVIPFEEETLTKTQQLNEYIMTSLRTMEGLDLNYVSKIFGEEKRIEILKAAGKYKITGKLKFVNQYLILTKEGKLFADGIAADLFS
jgi:oxygen-independent coproporphyrinogen III oxidase